MAKIIEIAYFCDDIPAMSRFYRELLGADPVAQSEDMAIFLAGETKIFLHKKYIPASGELPPENHFALAVRDLESACQALTNQGYSIETPPATYYWGKSAYLRDPEGHLIELSEAGLSE